MSGRCDPDYSNSTLTCDRIMGDNIIDEFSSSWPRPLWCRRRMQMWAHKHIGANSCAVLLASTTQGSQRLFLILLFVFLGRCRGYFPALSCDTAWMWEENSHSRCMLVTLAYRWTSQMVAPLKYAPMQTEAVSQTTINPTIEYIAAKVEDPSSCT